MRMVAKAISILFHPLALMLLAIFLVVFASTGTTMQAIAWVLYSAVFIGVLGGFVIWGVRKALFTNLDVSNRIQRKHFYVATVIIGCFFVSGLFLLKAPHAMFIIAVGVVGLLLSLSVANEWIKVSGHLACGAAFASTVIALYGYNALPAIIIIPILAWSRLYLHRHTPTEVVLGTLIGSIVSIATIVLVH